MGYYITLLESGFTLLAKNKPAALAAIKLLPSDNYSWVEDKKMRNAKTLENCLHEWGFEATTLANGDIVCLTYEWEKSGDEDRLFEAIAPYVEKGSYLRWSGEDGALWSNKFNGKSVRYKPAKIVW